MRIEDFNITKEKLKKRKADLMGRTPKSQEDALKIIRKIAKPFGYRIRKEHILKPYLIDVFIKDLSVGVELDGDCHDEGDGYDNRRDDFLWRLYGAKVYRFKNEDVYKVWFKQAIWDICIKGLDDRIVNVSAHAEFECVKINSKHFNPVPSLAKPNKPEAE